MGGIMHHKATWFLLGAAAMLFAYPWVRPLVPFPTPQRSS